MNDLFADGTGSVVVSNGVVRIELLQLRRKDDKPELESHTCGHLLVPVGSLKQMTAQLAKALEQIHARAAEKDRLESPERGESLDEALSNL